MPGRLWQGNGGTQAPQRGPGVGRCAGWRPAGSAWPHPEGQPCAGPQERVAEATATLENPPGLGPPAPGLTQSWAGSRRTFGSRHGPPALALSGCSGQGLPAGHAHESHVAGSAPWQGLALDAHAAALCPAGAAERRTLVWLPGPPEEASVRLAGHRWSAQGTRQRRPPADPLCPVPVSGGSGRGQAGLWRELASDPDSDGWAGALGPAGGEVSLLPSGHEASWTQPQARGRGPRAASRQVASGFGADSDVAMVTAASGPVALTSPRTLPRWLPVSSPRGSGLCFMQRLSLLQLT